MFSTTFAEKQTRRKHWEIQKQWQPLLTFWHMVCFYMELTHQWYFATFQLTPTYQHQRPLSVGMPRHALRRRIANPPLRRPRLTLGGGYFIIINVFFSGVCGFGKNKRREIGHSGLNRIHSNFAHFLYDLETQPYDLAENLHAATNWDSKNYFLVTLFWNFCVRFPPAP